MLTWELIGAVVGAGFASGREIASFFGRFGGWGFAGIAVAVLTILLMADVRQPDIWQGSLLSRIWRFLQQLLLIASGGAMLSGAGEIAALTLTFYGARTVCMAVTFIFSWWLAYRAETGLAWISRIMLIILSCMIALGFTLVPMKGMHIANVGVPKAIACGLAYGGFNAALLTPLLKGEAGQKNSLRKACLVLLVLMTLGFAVLQRHPALIDAEMPFVMLLREFGKFGYWVGAAALYLAILSTVTACFRGFGRNMLCLSAVCLIAMVGFGNVVERIYPMLGGCCFLMMLAAKFTNSSRKAFISP